MVQIVEPALEVQEEPLDDGQTELTKTPQKQKPIDTSYEPNFFRVIQGISVKTIVDSSRIPLEIVIPKAASRTFSPFFKERSIPCTHNYV
jgi:hypothetical protein